MRDFGYNQQGLSILVEKRKQWYKDSPTVYALAVGDRVAVFSDLNGGGIGIVKKVEGNEVYYTLFSRTWFTASPSAKFCGTTATGAGS